jgi:hypothetical protein
MKFFRDLARAGLVTAAVLLVLESGLRLARVHYEASLYQPEQERAYSLRPNAEGWSVDEAEVYIRINSDGMRDRERPISRPPQTLRVAVIGSSEAEARQVPLEETFKEVLNRDLSRDLESRGWQADVLNFGVPSFTFSQEYLTLRNHVWKYTPQVVILLFSTRPVLKTTRGFAQSELQGAPVYVLEDGKLVPDAITRNAPTIHTGRLLWKNRISDWMNRSSLLSLLNEAVVKSRGLVAALRPLLQTASSSAPPQLTYREGTGDTWRYNPDLPEIQESWAITDAFIKAMKEDCDQHGAEFWIVAADLEMQSHPSLAERAVFQNRLGLPSLDLVDRHLKSLGAANAIPVLALSQPLGQYAASHDVFLHGSMTAKDNIGHWNEVGHEVVGHAIARELVTRSLVVRGIESGVTLSKR